ncbi:MAG: phosphatase PAP2 family protein [archaeon]|nr:phosphatase PAP2 family protein [archaeon]
MSSPEERPWKALDSFAPQRNTWSRPIYAVWLGALFVFLSALPYSLINQFAGWRATSMLSVQSPLDLALPFLPWMMVFYISFYAYFPIMFWLGAAEHRRHQGERLTLRLIQASWVAFVIFLVFPVEVDLRHQVVHSDDSFASLFAALHALDTPYNAWPSLHVLQSLLVVLTVQAWLANDGALRPLLRALLWSAWTLLALSTMLVKQHYIFDAVTGLVIGVVLWRMWFKPVFNQRAH